MADHNGRNQPLRRVDAAFLAIESDTTPMHVGGVFVFHAAGSRLDHDRVRRLVASRLHRAPRYRQRVERPPLGLGPHWWVDDPSFALADHVRRLELPAPGTHRQLMAASARILARPLDRDRPLWELYVVEGLEGGRVALVGKNHHAMVDGIAGLGMAARLLDTTEPDRDVADQEIPAPRHWEPEPPPSRSRRVGTALGEAAAPPVALVRAARRWADREGACVEELIRAGRGVGALLAAQVPGPGAAGPLTHRTDEQRRLATRRLELGRVRRAAEAAGATVNDVVLSLVSDAVGCWLRAAGADTDGLWARVLVPVSVRGGTTASLPEDRERGNRVVGMFVDLPMFGLDPLDRLALSQERAAAAKASEQAVGAGALLGLAGLAPAPLHALAARSAANGRLYDLVVTNVPGPEEPISCLGAPLQAAYPFVPLGPDQPLAVGVASVGGALGVGFTGDGGVGDLAGLPGLLADALTELLDQLEGVDAHRAGRGPDQGGPGGGLAASGTG